MTSRFTLAVLLVAGCFPADPQDNNSKLHVATATPASYRLPQNCDSQPGYKIGSLPPDNGFLEVDKPYLMLSPEIGEILEGTYSARGAFAADVYGRFNTLRSEYKSAYEKRDLSTLRKIYGRLIITATSSLGEPRLTNSSIENFMAEQMYELAYLILTVDQRYSDLAHRDKLALALPWNREIRDLYGSKDPVSVSRSALAGMAVAPNGLRGLIVARLLDQDIAVAERLVVLGMYNQTDRDFYPVSHANLATFLRSPRPLEKLVFGKIDGTGGQHRCSDLFASYVEWLDLRSRVSRATNDRTNLRAVEAGLQRLPTVPVDLIGPRYQSAITGIARRVRLSRTVTSDVR